MDLTKKVLPNTVKVCGKTYSIYTDFRVWMEFENAVTNGRVQEFEPAKLFKNVYPEIIPLQDMFVFLRPPAELPRSIGGTDRIVLDYELDADYIYAAFLAQYGIDLIDIEYLHWHKFLALLKGLNSDQKLVQIMGYRSYDKNAGNKDQYEKLEYAWRIEKMTPEEAAELEDFSNKFE